MEAVLLQHEPWVRAAAFAAVLLAMALWELLAPRRILAYPRILRWPANLGIVLLNTALLRLALPMAAVGLAAAASAVLDCLAKARYASGRPMRSTLP